MNNVISSDQISLKKRFAWLALVVAIQAIYVPTSLRSTGGLLPKTPLDIFPLIPIWVVPYVLCYPLWFGGALWAALKMDDHSFRAFYNGAIFACAMGVTIFIVFPTYVIHPALPKHDFFSNLLQSIYVAGGSYDALPSAHNYLTALLSAFFGHWYPRRRLLWGLVYVVVALSTLFTGQHYILDVVTGATLGWLGYRFGLWRAGSEQPLKQ